MSPRNVLESQQSAHAPLAGRSAAGCWKLAAGRALSLRPREHSVLEIAEGRVWVTVSQLRPWHQPQRGAVVDQVLLAGECLAIEPGQHVVMEAWSPSISATSATSAICAGAVAFHWDRVPTVARAQRQAAGRWGRHSAAHDWDSGVVQPLRDLAHALGQGGRALGTAAADMAGAGGRFAAGLARFALHRIAAPLPRKPA